MAVRPGGEWSTGAVQEIASVYGVLLEKAGIALRGLFIIDPEGVLQHITINSLGVGRNVDEAKRVLQAIQFVKEHGEVRPHPNWHG
jgi:alkyl hydroperoxide reductase subunit AhpC